MYAALSVVVKCSDLYYGWRIVCYSDNSWTFYVYNFKCCDQLFQPKLHSKTPYEVTMLWLDSDLVVTILSPPSGPNLYHLDSYTVTMCTGYLVSSYVVGVQLPTRYLVDRFLHRPHSGCLLTCVVTVQLSRCWGLENSDYIVTLVVTVPCRWLME